MIRQITLLFTFLFLCVTQVSTQLACNTNISLSLSGDGNSILTPDMILEGNSGVDMDTLWVVPNTVDCSDIGEIEVTVHGRLNNIDYVCWSTLLVEDKLPPVAIVDIDVTIDVTNGPVTITPEMVDDGSHDNCDFTMSVNPSTIDCNSGGIDYVTLTVTDESGNSNVAQTNLHVIGDVDYSASIYCYNLININVANGPWELDLGELLVSAETVCSDYYTMDVNNITGGTVPADNIYGSSYVGETFNVEITNIITGSSCITGFTIIEAGDINSLCVSDFDNQELNNVKLGTNVFTNETGCADVYAIDGEVITVSKDDTQENGVDMIDALLMRMYILAQSTVTADQDFAADINGDGNVSTLDIVLLEKMLLGEYDFEQAWYFYNGNDPIGYGTKSEDVLSTIEISENQQNYDIIGVKKGDLDLSYDQVINVENKSAVQFKDAVLNVNETYSVDLYSADDATIYAADLKLLAETDEYEIIGVESLLAGYSFDPSLHIVDGKVNLNWLASEAEILSDGTIINAGDPIFTIHLLAKKNGILSNTFQFAENDNGKWFEGGEVQETKHIKLAVSDKISVPIFNTNFNDKLTISPNPAADFIVLKADKSIVEANYAIYSLNGTLMQKGKVSDSNQIDISVLNTGIYQVTITTQNSLYTQKLSVIR